MNHFIPLSVPNLKGNELKYVTEAAATEWVSTGGPYVTEFENKIAEYVNVKGAVACQNGTTGIHTALMTIGVKKDDIVIVPTLTFIAAVNPVKYIGATPIFMDCDDSLCIDPKKLKEFCEVECEFVDNELLFKLTKQKVKALVVVHVFGNMADMENILDIAKKYNLKVIEDATEAIGTYYSEGPLKGKYAGTMGDIGIYSFNGNKIITTGGGGMIVSNNEEYLKLAKHLTTQAKSDELNYIHDMIGYNYRMTNLQAALGLAQLEQLEKFIAAKNKNLTSIIKSTIAQAKDPSVSNPAAHVTLNQAGSKEAGTRLVPSYTASLTAGSYTYGPATGIVAETYSVTDGVEGHEAQTTATGSFPEIQVTDGMNYKLSVSITHNAGAVPKNNVGTEVPAKQIAAGTKTATSGSITAYRNSFYGSVTDKTAPLDSAAIRALSGKSGRTNTAGNTFNASESVGAMRVIIAVPAPRTCTSIKDVNGLNAEALSAFTKTTVNVEGANGYEAKAYNVYYKDNAAACDKANNWAVTLG